MSGSIKDMMIKTLPYSHEDITLRTCERSDYDKLVSWSPYEWPFDGFNFSFASLNRHELDQLVRKRQQEVDRVTLVADLEDSMVVGYVALLEVDWKEGWAYNMSIRVHPEYLSRGNGTKMLRAVRDWWLNAGMKGLRLDVAASNQRALRSYEKAGFMVVDEFWREAPDLLGVDLSDPRYGFLEGNVEQGEGTPRIRFYLMEISQEPLVRENM